MSDLPGHHSSHWYERADGPKLRQGDIVRDHSVWCVADEVPDDPEAPSTAHIRGTWIVLDASCDVDQAKVKHVLVARVVEASKEMLGANNEKTLTERLECIRQGLYTTRFLLAEIPGEFPLSFVEFRQHYVVPLAHLVCVNNRIRLRSPFREQFGNWVGSCFSRVGPEDNTLIPRFKQLHDAHRLRGSVEE